MISEVEVKELKRTIRLVARNLGTHHITGPEEYLEKFHSDLGLPASVLGDARNYGKESRMIWLGKVRSLLVAGVILYFASQNSTSPRTQRKCVRSLGLAKSP